MTGCSVSGCHNSTKNGCTMKILPRKNVPREKWIKSISRSKWTPDEYTYCICEGHYSAYKAVTLCCDGKQDLDSCAVSTIEPQRNSPSENNEMESTTSNASNSPIRLENNRIKNLKSTETSFSDSESTEFEVIEEIEYEVMEEETGDCDQSFDQDLEEAMIIEVKEEENSGDQNSEENVGKEIQIQEIKTESLNNCDDDQEKISNVNNSFNYLKNVPSCTEKLLKNQENLTPNCSQLRENFSHRDSSQNSDCNEERLLEKENSSVIYKTLNKNNVKLISSQKISENIKLHNNKILLIKKEDKIAPKQESFIKFDTEKSLLSAGDLIPNPKEKLHQELENTVKKNVESLLSTQQEIKKLLTLNQPEEDKCEKAGNEKQVNLIKNQEAPRIVQKSVANLQNKVFLVVKPETPPQSQETLPENYDKLNENQADCKAGTNQVILVKNQNNIQETPVISKVSGTNPVFLIQNPSKVPKPQENLNQPGVNQLFLILKQSTPPQNEENSEIDQERPQIKVQEKPRLDRVENSGGNKRKLRSMTKKENESNKRVCRGEEKLPTSSEKLIANRKKLSQYLQYLNEASKTVAEYKKNMIKQNDSGETSRNDEKNTAEEKKNEIDDDPFSTNDPEQFSIGNASGSSSLPTFNDGNINDNNGNNNDNSSSSYSSNNNNNNVNNNDKNSGSDKDKITYMNQLLEKQQQLLRVYRNKLGFARYKIKDQETKLELWRSMMETIFNEDQITYLEALQSQKKRCKCWSAATIKDAIDIKNIIGTVGYEELLRRKYPFPALRTLREKTQKPKDDD